MLLSDCSFRKDANLLNPSADLELKKQLDSELSVSFVVVMILLKASQVRD